jgi:cell wall-associated NlpC family hydrolase
MVVTAMNFLGVPYRRGGSRRKRGFDCSGFTRTGLENHARLALPAAPTIRRRPPAWSLSSAPSCSPAIWSSFNTSTHFSHVGIYIGDGGAKFSHAPKPGAKCVSKA